MRKYTLVSFAFLVASVTFSAAQKDPVVVAKIALTGQGQPIPKTKILALKDTLYRVSAYAEMVVTPPDCGSSVGFDLMWTDDTGKHRKKQWGLVECFDPAAPSSAVVVHGGPGSSLFYQVEIRADSGAQYNLYITVERLE